MSVSRARINIKLLEEADRLALAKLSKKELKKPYRRVLTEQEKQLHHYLSQYTDPNYLPKSITKEYESPKYFYYTINSKLHGRVQKRTRVDSAMFKRFMKSESKRKLAREQGIKVDKSGKANSIRDYDFNVGELLHSETLWPMTSGYGEHPREPDNRHDIEIPYIPGQFSRPKSNKPPIQMPEFTFREEVKEVEPDYAALRLKQFMEPEASRAIHNIAPTIIS
jgi:hypothetical protein